MTGCFGVEIVVDRRQILVLVRRLLRDVDAPQVADAGPGVRLLADADVELAVRHDRRGDDVVARSPPAAGLNSDFLGLQSNFQSSFARLRLEAVQPAVAAGEDHFLDAVDLGRGRVAPLPVHDVRAGQIALPGDLAALLVDGQEARGVRRCASLPVFDVHAVGGHDVHQIAEDQRRAVGEAAFQAAGVDPEVLDHVQRPDDLALALGGGVAGHVGTNQLAAVADVIEPVAVHGRRRGDARRRSASMSRCRACRGRSATGTRRRPRGSTSRRPCRRRWPGRAACRCWSRRRSGRRRPTGRRRRCRRGRPPLDALLLVLFDAPRVRNVLFDRIGHVALDRPAEHRAVVGRR